MIEYYIDGTKIDVISDDSFRLNKQLTNRESNGSFSSRQFEPSLNNEIEVYKDSSKIFGGKITEVRTSFQDGRIPIYEVDFQDYTLELQKKVVQRYEERTEAEGGKWTVEEVIDDVISRFAPSDFDTTNVDCSIEVDELQFNYISIKEVIEELAELVSYDWYVDEDRSIHFFEKNTRTAPFNIDETSGNLFFRTLELTKSIEQLKNAIFVRGGTKTSGSKIQQNLDEQVDGSNDQLKTGYTFVYRRDDSGNVIEPTLTKDGVEVELGIENEDSFDAEAATYLTNFDNNNDIEYTATTPGTGGNDISVEYVIDNPNQTLSSSVTSKKITVYLESNYNSESRSTANEVVNELQSNTNVTDLVSVNTAVDQDGEGIVPTMTETSLTGGAEGVEALYNQEEKVILTNVAYESTDEPVIVEGRIRVPVQVVVRDPSSQDLYELEVEHLIVDRSLQSTEEATKKAKAEIERFARHIERGSFETHQDGLKPGQVLDITSSKLGIDNTFIITRVEMQEDGDKFRYRIGFTTRKSKELIDLLKQLMRTESKNINISDEEVLAKIEDYVEQVSWKDDYIENPIAGSDINWIAGPYFPNREDKDRVPRADGGAKA